MRRVDVVLFARFQYLLFLHFLLFGGHAVIVAEGGDPPDLFPKLSYLLSDRRPQLLYRL